MLGYQNISVRACVIAYRLRFNIRQLKCIAVHCAAQDIFAAAPHFRGFRIFPGAAEKHLGAWRNWR
jgi:hypothetical protein